MNPFNQLEERTICMPSSVQNNHKTNREQSVNVILITCNEPE